MYVNILSGLHVHVCALPVIHFHTCALSFNVETVISSENNEGALSAMESDPERHQLNSLTLTTPDIVTGIDSKKTSHSRKL